jgi:hypothetical protein
LKRTRNRGINIEKWLHEATFTVTVTESKDFSRNTPLGTGIISTNRLLSESRGGTAMSVKYINVAEETPFGRIYVLPKTVSAIQILPSDESGSTRLGLLTQLPEGAEIEIGGPGFNDGTLRIRCGNASYYVFLDDLELVRKHADVAYA